MRYPRLAWTAAVGLAIGVFSGIVALIHDAPRSYDVSLQVSRWAVYARATPRHVVVGAHAFSDIRLDRPLEPIWRCGPLAVVSIPRDGATEALDLARDVSGSQGSWRLGDFGYVAGDSSAAVTWRRQAIVPTWLACLAGVTPLAVLVLARNHRKTRAAMGQCLVCGYDLRATPGRCPECGSEAATPASVVKAAST